MPSSTGTGARAHTCTSSGPRRPLSSVSARRSTRPARRSRRPAPSGRGIAGMRARAAAAGGWVETVRGEETFEVLAFLPVAGADQHAAAAPDEPRLLPWKERSHDRCTNPYRPGR